jgi:hypothetical protein
MDSPQEIHINRNNESYFLSMRLSQKRGSPFFKLCSKFEIFGVKIFLSKSEFVFCVNNYDKNQNFG